MSFVWPRRYFYSRDPHVGATEFALTRSSRGTTCGMTEFGHGERPVDVHVIHQSHVVEDWRDPRVLAEVVDDVRRFGDQSLDVLRVALAVLRSGDVVLAPVPSK